MIYIIGAAGLASAISYALARRLRTVKAALKAETERAGRLAEEVERLGHVIQRIEEVNREAAQRQERLSVGSDTDKFDASLDVLSNLSRGPTGTSRG
jgi:shikimate 5-dehydrogenase